MAERPVITGIGAVSALGASARATWAALLAGRSGVAAGVDASPAWSAPGGVARVSGPDAEGLGVDARTARIMGHAALMMLQAGREALDTAGLPATEVEPERTACFAGLGMVDPEPDDLRRAVLRARGRDGIDYARFFADAYREIHPLWPLAMLNNVGFSLAAERLGARGENAVFSPCADAAFMALVEAASTVAERRAEVALAAGASESATVRSLARAHLAGAGGSERPVVLGEAAAVLVVEPEARAHSRGARPLASVAGWGFGFGAAPERALADAMGAALDRAGADGSDLDAVLLAGVDGSAAPELGAIDDLLGSQGAAALLASKHALGCAGPGGAALDLVLAVMMVSADALPEALRAGPQGERVDRRWRAGRAEAQPRRVLVNARSRGGQVASVVVAGVR